MLGNVLPWLVGLFLGPDLEGGGDQEGFLLSHLGREGEKGGSKGGVLSQGCSLLGLTHLWE